ncbi:MAG: DMT family transporter [Actinobacteria bacterium]|nr:MAG: DMT family transporter [Actinomycetota bacterium]
MEERVRYFNPGVLEIAAAALIWGSMGVLIRLLQMGPVAIVFWRSAFACAALLLFMLLTGRARQLVVRRHRLLLALTGILLLFSMVFFVLAVQLTTIANAVLIVYTAPVLIALLAPLILRERFELRMLLSLALALTGIALIVAPRGLSLESRHALGVAYAFACAFSYALLVLAGKKIVHAVSARVIAFYQSLLAAVLLLPFAARLPPPPAAVSWVMLVVLGIVHTALAGMLYLAGLRTVKAADAGTLSYLEPLSAAVYALVFLGEPLTSGVIAGGLLIVAAGWIVIVFRPAGPAAVPR